jgi:hypothetical protein
MGQTSSQRQQSCFDICTINGILNGTESNLTDEEAMWLYRQFNKVVQCILLHRHDHLAHINCTPRLPVQQILKYKRIGYYCGDIIAFRVAGDPLPWVLFEYQNALFEQTYRTIKEVCVESPRKKRRASQELLLRDCRQLCVKVAEAEECSSHGVFRWVVDARYDNVVQCQ